MERTRNKVLCIVPLYNKINFLPLSIGSVLNQEGADIIMVIVDDGSTDGSYEWVQQHVGHFKNVHILKNEENLGCYQTRNRGLHYAIENNIEFDFYTVTDPDDTSIPGRFRTILNVFNNEAPQATCITNPYHRYNIDTKIIIATEYDNGEGSAWFRRELFDILGYWDNTLRMSGDTEYVIRLKNYYVKAEQKDYNDYVGVMTDPLVYCLVDNEGQNLTALYTGEHPMRKATWNYIDEYTYHGTANDTYYEYNNTGHAYAGMGAPSFGN
jgi:glycosyltransferase involved in cell wall biosynthesis